MKTILFSALLRNNASYVPNMIKLFENLENDLKDDYNLNVLIYTNNNADNTLSLLKQNKINNIEIIAEDLKEVDTYEDISKTEPKVIRLYTLREKVLKEIMKRQFDYLFMFDSDIYFNTPIITNMINTLDKEKYEAIVPNTIGQMLPLYYDTFSLWTKNGESGKSKSVMFRFHRQCLDDKIIEVKSAFGGLFLTDYSTLQSKKPSYLHNGIDNKVCEHVPFVQHFKTGFVTDLTPIRVNVDRPYKHHNAYSTIKNNNTDNRKYTYHLTLFVFVVLLALFFLYMSIKYKYYFIILFGVCFVIIFNYCCEFM